MGIPRRSEIWYARAKGCQENGRAKYSVTCTACTGGVRPRNLNENVDRLRPPSCPVLLSPPPDTPHLCRTDFPRRPLGLLYPASSFNPLSQQNVYICDNTQSVESPDTIV